jgi:hypothetical protein
MTSPMERKHNRWKIRLNGELVAVVNFAGIAACEFEMCPPMTALENGRPCSKKHTVGWPVIRTLEDNEFLRRVHMEQPRPEENIPRGEVSCNASLVGPHGFKSAVDFGTGAH